MCAGALFRIVRISDCPGGGEEGCIQNRTRARRDPNEMGPTRYRTTPNCRRGGCGRGRGRGTSSIQRFLISVALFLRFLGCARWKRWWWWNLDGRLRLRIRIPVVSRSYCTRFDTDKYRCKIAAIDQTQKRFMFCTSPLRQGGRQASIAPHGSCDQYNQSSSDD